MRPLAGLAIALIGLNTAGAAMAQSAPLAIDLAAARLMNAAFQPDAGRGYDAPASQSDPISALLEHDAWRPDQGLTRWGVREMVVAASPDGSAVDSLRLRVGETLPQKKVTALDLARGLAETDAYDVTLIRNWPRVVAFESARYDIDLTPHAGFGVGSSGGSAEAGATLTLGRKTASQQVAAGLGRLGFREGASDGDNGRWYVFAAASGRAVGLSLTAREAGSNWSRTLDSSSALIGDAQVGVGWRKGAMQTSLGYIHRSVKGDHMIWGQQAQDDSMVAFSLSIKPKH
jgi:hypothetical protein